MSSEPLCINEAPADWEAISFPVLCSRCRYDLRSLRAPVCPECGLRFEWARVIERASRQTLTFERDWRRRPVRLLVGTLLGTLRPGRHWNQITTSDEIRLGPLIFLIVISPVVFLGGIRLLAALLYLLLRLAHGPPNSSGMMSVVAGALGSPPAPVDYYLVDLYDLAFSIQTRQDPGLWISAGIVLAAFISLLIAFTILNRWILNAVDGPAHAVRIVAYVAAPTTLAWSLLYMVAFSMQLMQDIISPIREYRIYALGELSVLIVPLWLCLRAAIRHYLHRRSASAIAFLLIVVAAVPCVALVMAVVVVVMAGR